ncbi:MAG: hypothetical protein K6F77_03555 [Lachnospiraceae bacterium]|nr:hypothetical protein [Lachnospiraceae bacterium]
MTLLITVFAAAIVTGMWYKNAPNDSLNLNFLMWLYWGASLMWFVDAIFEYVELRDAFFTPAVADMINDSFLGLSVVAFGLVLWVIQLLVKDPKGVLVKKSNTVKKESEQK